MAAELSMSTYARYLLECSLKATEKLLQKASTGDSFSRVLGNGQVIALNLDSINTSGEKNSSTNAPKKNDAKHGVFKNSPMKMSSKRFYIQME